MTTILITNDDGIHSPGLRAAAEAVSSLGTILIIAPSSQQTGTGRGLFGDKDLCLLPTEYRVNNKNIEAYQCDCSPALIVRHSLRTILKEAKPDLIISGINYGENLGFNITSSGTVGAALEGASFGVPCIAISKQTDISSHHSYSEQDWTASMHFLAKFSKSILVSGLPADVDLLKIDIPDDASIATEWRLTTLARSGYYFREVEKPSVKSTLGGGKTVIKVDETMVNKDSDIYAIFKKRLVSVTPISLDLTSRVNFQELHENLDR
jgi:5'-nucleotidase